MLNFEKLEYLNISSNWIGMQGLEHLKVHFRQFQSLKVLKLTSNKLFLMPDHRTEHLKEMLLDIKDTLEEFHIAENAMEKADFEILT